MIQMFKDLGASSITIVARTPAKAKKKAFDFSIDFVDSVNSIIKKQSSFDLPNLVY